MARSAIAVTLLACCGGAETPAPPPVATAPLPSNRVARTPATACIEFGARFSDATVQGNALISCWSPADLMSTAPSSCWSFDLSVHGWTPSEHRDLPRAPTQEPVKATSATAVEACTPAGNGTCIAVVLKPPGAPDPSAAAMTADGSLIAVVTGGKVVRVFDATGAKIGDISSWPTEMSSPGKPALVDEVHFFDDTLAVYVGSTPVTDEVRLFAPRTGKLLGGLPAVSGFDEERPFYFGGHHYGVLEFDAPLVHVLDVTTGKLVRDLRFGNAEIPSKVVAWATELPDNNLVGLNNMTAVLIDVPTGATARFPAPVCPPPPPTPTP